MRGRKSKMKGMRLGQTIVAEREHAESESERMQARKRAKRKQRTSVMMVVLMLIILGLMAYLGVKEMSKEYVDDSAGVVGDYQIVAEIVDEDNRGQISARVRDYIAQLEQDFRDLGYTVTKVILPTGTSRELYVDLDGQTEYFKVTTDRETAVTAEDAVRMIKYLEERDLHPEYVDVRVEGKAYYK